MESGSNNGLLQVPVTTYNHQTDVIVVSLD
jgi:hypothetical protein